MTTMFLAQYSFKGNSLAGLLSFQAREMLIAMDPRKLDVNGWAYVHLASSTKQFGWFPLAHMRQARQSDHGWYQSRSETKQQTQLLYWVRPTPVPTDLGRGRESVEEKLVALFRIEEGEDEEEDVSVVFDWRRGC
jgi:hypothetical protein